MDRDRKAPIEGFSGRHYFMTIVAQGRACLFGEVVENQMRLDEAGGMVQEVCWGLSQRFPGVEVGSFVVMPNHVHGIIVLQETVGASLVGAQCEAIGDIGDNRATGNDRATTRVAPTLGECGRGVQITDHGGIYEGRPGSGMEALSWPAVATQLLRTHRAG